MKHWLAVLAFLPVYTQMWLAPATWWFEPTSLDLRQDVPGGEVVVLQGRRIYRNFDGAFQTAVFMAETDAPPVCGKGDSRRYAGGKIAPYEMPLSKWTNDPACKTLPPGAYYAQGCWVVLRPFFGIVPAKSVCIVSPVAHIK